MQPVKRIALITVITASVVSETVKPAWSFSISFDPNIQSVNLVGIPNDTGKDKTDLHYRIVEIDARNNKSYYPWINLAPGDPQFGNHNVGNYFDDGIVPPGGVVNVYANLSSITSSSEYKVEGYWTPVPEPLSILGTITAIGFGIGFKRKIKSRKLKTCDNTTFK